MAVTWVTPVEVTPGSTGWQDVDLSSNIASGSTGVMFHVVNNGTSTRTFGCRKNGSSDDRTSTAIIDNAGHQWASCGVDANRVCEINCANTSDLDIYLVGYWTSDAVFNTNATNIALSTTSAWTDIDINVNDSAVGAIIEINDTGTYHNWGLRKNGSTDARTTSMRSCSWAIIGLDANEVLEGYISATTVDFYLTGYIKANATFNTNATDLSLGSTGAYADLTALPAGGTGGFIEVQSSSAASYTYALRKNGSSEDIYLKDRYHNWAFVEADTNRVIEGKISNTGLDFYLVGYTTAVAGTGYSVDVGGATMTPTGTLANSAGFNVSAGGATITPVGGLSKGITKSMGGATLTPTGNLAKGMTVVVGGATVTPIGNTPVSFGTAVNTGGATITPVGSLVKGIGKAVGGATLTPVGEIVKGIGKSVGGAVITPVGNLSKGILKSVGGAVMTAIGALTTEKGTGSEPEPPTTITFLNIRRFLRALKDDDD